MRLRNNPEYAEAGFFVLAGPLELEKLRPGGRGMPLGKDAQIDVKEVHNMGDFLFEELSDRLQAVEEALRQREKTFTQGINLFAEKVASVLVEEQKKALAEQEERLMAAVKLLWEQSAQTRGKIEPERQTSWLSRLFDAKSQT